MRPGSGVLKDGLKATRVGGRVFASCSTGIPQQGSAPRDLGRGWVEAGGQGCGLDTENAVPNEPAC